MTDLAAIRALYRASKKRTIRKQAVTAVQRAKADTRARKLLERVHAGESHAAIAADIGVTRCCVTRAISRYRERHTNIELRAPHSRRAGLAPHTPSEPQPYTAPRSFPHSRRSSAAAKPNQLHVTSGAGTSGCITRCEWFGMTRFFALTMETPMPADSNNVLLPLRLPTQKELRNAVANMIRDIQRDHKESDQCTADRLGVSIGTIRNARNETADLGARTIASIGASYGADYTGPFLALYGATATLVQRDTTDPLCHMARMVTRLCDMRCPDGPGGSVETPKELLDALPDMKRARAALDGLIARTEKLRLVA